MVEGFYDKNFIESVDVFLSTENQKDMMECICRLNGSMCIIITIIIMFNRMAVQKIEALSR